MNEEAIMSDLLDHVARSVPTRFVEAGERTLAYRMFGEGPPLVLALRFRGVMDDWDPDFLDALATRFTVVTFDYSGLGQSTGTPSYVRETMALDILDLIDALNLAEVALAGWSLGGIAAQVFTALYPERVTHLVPIGTMPPGPMTVPSDPLFLQTALKPNYDLEDETILFFEPAWPRSRAAAVASHFRIAARTGDRSPKIPEAIWLKMLHESNDATSPFPDPQGIYRDFYAATTIPVLAICGDHDIMFPVENWYALNRANRSLHMLTFPQAGHGPQHEHPQLAADAIASFVRNIR
jgi:pimeloyl-ACP methyl ester carboxylesterase